jgi:hypothetical protein
MLALDISGDVIHARSGLPRSMESGTSTFRPDIRDDRTQWHPGPLWVEIGRTVTRVVGRSPKLAKPKKTLCPARTGHSVLRDARQDVSS